MDEKVVVTVRTLNEEATIERFCRCYDWADEILIADGGSTDKTLDLARRFNNTSIMHFTDKVWHSDTMFSNPRGKHINFLIDRAKAHEADWIIFDDCDCVPTVEMQKIFANARIGESCKMVFAFRMFILGDSQWFPDMNYDRGQSLWAWRAEVPVKADESSHTISMEIPTLPDDQILRLERPLTLLHYFYPNEETLQRKKSQYLFTGEVQKDYDPIRQFGRVDNLPEWAKWK